MLKRIAIIAFFTGSGQVLSIFVLKFLSHNSSIEQLNAIAEIDSLVFFLMNLIALGLQTTAMRNLAQPGHWEQEYYDTQSARITLGILLMGVAALAFINEYYILFLIAPLLAWNGDYALYARGHPVAGSMIAFVRLAIPYSTLLIAAVYYPDSLGWIFVISLTLVYLLTNVYISYFLKTTYIFKPSFKKLKLYISSLPLGIVAVALYFMGLGLVLVVPYFYTSVIVTTAFVGLKFYMIFKGVLRIIHQAFFKEMWSEAICLKVDQLSIIAATILFGSLIIFPESFITFFFGTRYLDQKAFFIILGIDAFIYAAFLSFGTKAILHKQDRKYTLITIIAAITTIAAVIVFSFITNEAINIAIGLGIGELLWAMGLAVYLSGSRKEITDRLIFIAAVLPLLLIPLAIRYWTHDRFIYYIISFSLLALLMLVLHYNKFKTLSHSET